MSEPFPTLMPATVLKKRLWHVGFPVNFVKFIRTPFFIEHLWWLLQSICHNAIIFFQSASFDEQIRQTISLSEIVSDHKLLIKAITQVNACVTWCLFLA